MGNDGGKEEEQAAGQGSGVKMMAMPKRGAGRDWPDGQSSTL